MPVPRFTIEAHNSTAALYVRVPLQRADMRDLRIAFALLPASVCALRIDATAIRDLRPPTSRLLREGAKHWERTRGGRVEWCVAARARKVWSTHPGARGAALANVLPRDPALAAVFL